MSDPRTGRFTGSRASETIRLKLQRCVSLGGLLPVVGFLPDAQAYEELERGIRIILAREPPNSRLHISVSCRDRDPTWDELVAVKQSFAPDLTMAVYIPPEREYVNFHDHVFHLREARHDIAGEKW